MKQCLIYLDNAQIQNSIDLLETARQIYANESYETVGVSIGEICEKAIGAFDKIVKIENDNVRPYDQMAVSDAIIQLYEVYRYDSILFPASHFGRMIAPRVAMKLKTGLVADVTAINRKDGKLEIIRPAFSGRLMAGIECLGSGPIMMSVRQGVFKYKNPAEKLTEEITFELKEAKDGKIRILSVKEKPQAYDIRESKVLVSGGGGIMKNFSSLDKLADKLNAQVSVSRKIVDNGSAPRSIQVGQSGKTVNPKLYIAIGINGAIQHVEGLKQVDCIISVNTNKNAPICSLSDIVVEGDAVKFIDMLVEKIEKSSAK